MESGLKGKERKGGVWQDVGMACRSARLDALDLMYSGLYFLSTALKYNSKYTD